jgi:large subunit ribosomal protein L15
MVNVNVGTIQNYIDMGRLPTDKVLTLKDLVDSGMIKASAIKHGVKLLADGKETVRDPIQMHVSRASQAAIAAIENVGGEVTTVHYNRLALRALLKPEKFDILPKFARPPPKLQPYYTNWENRGYLSVQAQMRELLKKKPELRETFDAAILEQIQKAARRST